eukprot:TRINITY_DN14248_c0_g1_i1.p2 TRINITY_DN14248_c0_g1~~TRINITY_DN14248_c0_g1_i1.p2  ORF type:complete len:133 (+),score=43.41 TRINITY_DN14248_c0_g1_i1:88-486(+)
MVFYQIFHPVLYGYTKLAPYLVRGILRTFGVRGLIALPFMTLTSEKIIYDTFIAMRGIDLYKEDESEQVYGDGEQVQFPQGGGSLGSWSVMPIASEEDRWIFEIFGDKPRGWKEAEAAEAEAAAASKAASSA